MSQVSKIDALEEGVYALHRGSTLWIDYFPALVGAGPGQNVLAITFTERGNSELEGNGFGGGFLLGNGFDVLAIKSTSYLWFEELSDELVAELQRFLEAGSYTARVAYGSSMGGYAAIRYARAFRVNRVVAISPLYDIRLPEDPRWLEDIPALQRPTMMTSEEVMPLCEYSIIFDPVCPDLLQINRFREILPAGQIHVVEIPDAGHPAEMFLHETGILKDLALSLLLGLRKDLQNYAIDPRTSPTYLNNLADRLFVSGKPGEALEPALAAHALDPDNPENLTLIARIYDDLDESAEAERFARRSMAIDATSPHRNTILVHILAKKHEFKEALEILEGVISLDPSIEHSHELYADLSAKMPEP